LRRQREQRPTAAGRPVEVKSTGPNGALLHVALVQNNVASRVTAGANGGSTPHHDFVVPAADLAATAFVQAVRGEVLQAFSLPVSATQAE
jgi:hypothetical protein